MASLRIALRHFYLVNLTASQTKYNNEYMAIELDLFSLSNFQNTIQHYCTQLQWKLSDINSHRAILKFWADSGNNQTLFIIRFDTTLEFSVPTALKFNNIDEVPGWMSTRLLCKNTQYKIGFWCLENIENKKMFSIMHNAEISLINVNYFQKVVLRLVSECDEFEQAVSQALRSY